MWRQDYWRFIAKATQFQEAGETTRLMMDLALASVGLCNALDDISKSKALDENIQKIINLLQWTWEVERCTLYLYNKEKGCLYVKASSEKVRKAIEIPTKTDDYVMDSFLHGKMIIK